MLLLSGISGSGKHVGDIGVGKLEALYDTMIEILLSLCIVLWTINTPFHERHYHMSSSQLPCTLNVRPLAVFLSFSSFSGRALRSTSQLALLATASLWYIP